MSTLTKRPDVPDVVELRNWPFFNDDSPRRSFPKWEYPDDEDPSHIKDYDNIPEENRKGFSDFWKKRLDIEKDMVALSNQVPEENRDVVSEYKVDTMLRDAKDLHCRLVWEMHAGVPSNLITKKLYHLDITLLDGADHILDKIKTGDSRFQKTMSLLRRVT